MPAQAPLCTFSELGVPAALVDVLDEQGIKAPFPVQAATLPDALAGRDILGRARTGSGKTLGFVLPLVSRLAGRTTLPARPRGLVLVPTRELATQVSDVLRPLARAAGLGATTIYGGVSYGPQVNALRRRTDIVVATPGRLADLIGQGECDLSDIEVTVIDEADQMADLGFLPVVRRLLETTPGDGQRMLFSATLDAAVDVLARQFLHDPVLHSVDEHSSPAEIEHHVLTVDGASRVAVLAALAGGEKRSLVFTRTKHGAERLARQLTDAGIPAAELHGNLRQGARSRNLAAFASGIARVMVATDIAARGIHVDGIDLVIHADPPAEHKAYVHRSGRTARGGAEGVVVTLQTKGQAHDVTAMMRKANIAPHPAVAVGAQSQVLADLAGEPAPRVEVSGKVAELVRPEDRLGTEGRPGAGKPREGGPRRGPKPRGERFRGHGARDFAHRDGDRAPGRDGTRPEAPAGPRQDRAERAARFERDDRPSRFVRDDRPPSAERFEPASRSERPSRFQHEERPARDDRDRPRRFDTERQPRADRADRFGRVERRPGNRGPAVRPSAGRPDREPGQAGHDWWPRSGGRPGARPGSPGNRDDRGRGNGYRPGNRTFRDDRPARDDRAFRDDRPARDDRGSRDDRAFRDDRPARDDRPFRDDRGSRDDRPTRDDRAFRAGRPQAGGRPAAGGQPRARTGRDGQPPQGGGSFGGSSRPSGYSAGRGSAGKRRDSGQGRHF
jgi:superfamily II DNA/RNA helicase